MIKNGKGALGIVEAALGGAVVGVAKLNAVVEALPVVADCVFPDVLPTTPPPDTELAVLPLPPVISPVHAAPNGQHATLSAASLVQIWFVGQQAPAFP